MRAELRLAPLPEVLLRTIECFSEVAVIVAVVSVVALAIAVYWRATLHFCLIFGARIEQL